ncbi:SIMPL domain-containing protein [Qipengyuania flava]|nr:SIMPL domain-containing protein [Qipengyuania flava]
MIRYAIPAFAFAAALPMTAQAAEIQIAATGPVVELNVLEEVDAAPDMVTVSAGVSSEAPTAVEALRQNSRAMRAVIDRIKSLGVAERDIQTSSINLNARYDYDQQRQEQIFRGYRASNRVTVKLREIDETGEVLDALVVAGATDLNGPVFGLENDERAKVAARRAALQRAEAQAREYASLAGYSNVRLLEISESVQGRSGPQPIVVTGSRLKAMEESAPVEPGTISTGVSISVKYEMTR